MMRRRRGLLAFVAWALAAPRWSGAQQASKLPIGWLSLTPRGPFFQDFRQGLQELGYAAPDTEIEKRYSAIASALTLMG